MAHAHRIAEKHGLYFVPVNEKGHTAYVLYRKLPEGSPRHGARIARRKNEGSLLKLVEIVAGVADAPPAPKPEEPAL